jgi:hypothetical protein
VPVATLSREIGVSVGRYTGWIGVSCGLFEKGEQAEFTVPYNLSSMVKISPLPSSSVPILATLPPVPSLPAADSAEFVLLSVPSSFAHLEEDDRLERVRRRLAFGQEILRQREACFQARQASHWRDVARSRSLQVYIPPVSHLSLYSDYILIRLASDFRSLRFPLSLPHQSSQSRCRLAPRFRKVPARRSRLRAASAFSGDRSRCR